MWGPVLRHHVWVLKWSPIKDGLLMWGSVLGHHVWVLKCSFNVGTCIKTPRVGPEVVSY